MSDYKSPQSAEEVLVRYRNGERCFTHSDLDTQGVTCDFRGLDLTGIDFSGSFLYADFRGADLTNANFDHCSVKTCDFRGAFMSGADFEDATCSGYSIKAGEVPEW